MKKKGFDPNDLNKKDKLGDTPMIYFIIDENVTMVRYLIAHGADCRTTDEGGRFPLYYAASRGHLEIVRLLSHDGGAHEDIRRVTRDGNGCSPLRIALHKDYFDVVWWLILNGALAPLDDVDGGGIDDAIMRRDLRQEGAIDDMVMRRDLRQETYNTRQENRWRTVLSWARGAVATHDNVVQLLVTGTIVRTNNQESSLLVPFKGTSGILELIAHYISGTKQQLRTLRQLLILLPAFIAGVPFVEEDEDE